MAKIIERIRLHNFKPRRVPRSYKRVGIKLSARIEITVVVRSKGSGEEWSTLVAKSISGPPGQRQYLTRAAFGKAWGASPADLKAVSAFGKTFGLKTVSADRWRRCVVLSGTLKQMAQAFGVKFFGVKHPLGLFRSIRGVPQIAKSLHRIVEAVLGLDNMPSLKSHLAARRRAGAAGLNLGELRKVYGFPPRYYGKGQCVAVIEPGGGLYKSDYNGYFRRIGLKPPALRIRVMPGGSNKPASRAAMKKFAKTIWDGSFPYANPTNLQSSVMGTWEVAMDLEIIGTLAPEAKLLLVFATFDDQSQYHAITSTLADARNAPSAISCSWGMDEQFQTPILMPVLDRWFQAAAVLGVTVCFSAGDVGDGTLIDGGKKPLTFETQFPATSPYVLACGGTTLDVEAGTETAWKQNIDGGYTMAGGGGFSDVFPLPPWQVSAGIDAANWIPADAISGSGRAIPDVCAKADLNPAFSIIAGGAELPASGTSAAAPLWAALIAVLNQALHCPAGSINELLYGEGLGGALRDITQGDIGYLWAQKGWDPATGWGSPHGKAILEALKGGS